MHAEVFVGEAWALSSGVCRVLVWCKWARGGGANWFILPTLFLINTRSLGSLYLSRFPRSLPCVPLPSLQFDCQETGGRESPKPRPGSQMGGGGGQDWHLWDYCCIWLNELVIMVYINPLPLSSHPPTILCSQYSQCDAEVPRGERWTDIWQNFQPENW